MNLKRARVCLLTTLITSISRTCLDFTYLQHSSQAPFADAPTRHARRLVSSRLFLATPLAELLIGRLPQLARHGGKYLREGRLELKQHRPDEKASFDTKRSID